MSPFALAWPSAVAVLPALLDAAVKGAVVLAAACLLVSLLRRAPAAARHLVWCLGLLALLVLPVLSATLPGWQVPLPLPVPERAVTVGPAESFPTPGPTAELLPSGPGPRPAPVAVPPNPPEPDLGPAAAPPPAPEAYAEPEERSSVGPIVWPVWAWLAGALLALLPVAGGLVSLRRLRRRCRRVVDGPLADLLRQLRAEAGVGRPVALVLSGRRTMPMTWGVRRPVVLLPAEAEGWPTGRLRVVLLHELAHVRRRDCLTQTLAHVARALHWFNPLAWLALRGLRAEQERACDDVVLRAGTDAADYAGHLLALVSRFRPHPLAVPVALAMGRAARLERRVVAILDAGCNRRPLPRRRLALVFLAAFALLGSLAATRWQPAPPPADKADAPDKAPDAGKRVEEARTKILRNYVEAPDEKTITDSAIEGMVKALKDPYSEYLSPEMLARFQMDVRGSLTGIGAQLRHEGKRVAVVTPLPDSPAFKAGLRPGDLILAVDGTSTEGLTLPEVVKRIIGPAGKVVKLKVRHAGGKEAELAITRARVKVESVVGFRRGAGGRWDFLLDPAQKIGYVHVTHFAQSTPAEARAAFKRLKAAGVKGLILDLRSCPGGLLSAAVDVTRMLLDEGTIVTVKGRERPASTYKADGKAILDVPVLVLLDGHTASAGEIVAGALGDNKRATLLGTRSFGKGSIQEIIKLGGKDGALKLTTGFYQLPGGRAIHRRPGAKTWGVDPTDGYYLALTPKQEEEMAKRQRERYIIGGKETPRDDKMTPDLLAKKYADPQLAAALKTMTARLTTGSFIKVGKGKAAEVAEQERIEDLKRQREELRKKLATVEKELGGLDKPGDGKPPPPPKEKP